MEKEGLNIRFYAGITSGKKKGESCSVSEIAKKRE